jgi:hypothetical protein
MKKILDTGFWKLDWPSFGDDSSYPASRIENPASGGK